MELGLLAVVSDPLRPMPVVMASVLRDVVPVPAPLSAVLVVAVVALVRAVPSVGPAPVAVDAVPPRMGRVAVMQPRASRVVARLAVQALTAVDRMLQVPLVLQVVVPAVDPVPQMPPVLQVVAVPPVHLVRQMPTVPQVIVPTVHRVTVMRRMSVVDTMPMVPAP